MEACCNFLAPIGGRLPRSWPWFPENTITKLFLVSTCGFSISYHEKSWFCWLGMRCPVFKASVVHSYYGVFGLKLSLFSV